MKSKLIIHYNNSCNTPYIIIISKELLVFAPMGVIDRGMGGGDSDLNMTGMLVGNFQETP